MIHFKSVGLAAAAASGAALFCAAAPAAAQSEPILGQVSLFAMNWCPRGWEQADGELMAISQNSSLFSLYGTTYGGDGQTTFGLPDLRNRAPVSWSSSNPIGTQSGSESVTLTVNQMPTHTHTVFGTTQPTGTNDPTGALLGTFPDGQTIYAPNTATPDVPMHAGIIGYAGGNQPVPTQSPVLAMTWCVATEGIYPSRS
ncbi:phage tail protein [Brevundimonas sp.]|uniref:phage tail protein n=1 Tax=Brevundimonas sp. TaxID=1871086 RepID=UPI002D6C3ABC|nr:tail fiber protein [Brevundimonas sp.]HYC75907.1 tail fiber protein [Brevundimonas sp.]